MLDREERSQPSAVVLTAIAVGHRHRRVLSATAQTVVGVSWSNFQEERWKTDEAAIKARLEKTRRRATSAPTRGGSPEKQLADVDGLMAKGAKALIVLAMDKDAILARRSTRPMPSEDPCRSPTTA